MTEKRQSKGKATLPYLLSTTKTLARCKQYYYKGLDYKFNSHRNRDCYTERNVRINMTRMWHNIIIPNAILCSMYGNPATLEDAIAALNYAMIHGKTPRSIEAWNAVCEYERKLSGTKDSVVYTYTKSFYFYAMGMGATLEGRLYHLTKSAKFDITKYLQHKDTCKYIFPITSSWKCPWNDLNRLVYRFIHWEDDFESQCAAYNKKIEEIQKEYQYRFGDEDEAECNRKIEAVQNELDSLECPAWPKTQRALVDTFHVSMTSATRFVRWRKQLAKVDSKAYYDPKKIRWTPPKACKEDFIDVEDTHDDIVDIDDTLAPVDDSVDIDLAIQRAVDSGNRPIGTWNMQSL